jgi:hypothetical protein
MLSDVLRFVRNGKNRAILSWIGGGLVVIIAGIWGIFVYVFPSPHAAAVQASCGSVAIGGNVAGTNIRTGSTMSADCPTKLKP